MFSHCCEEAAWLQTKSGQTLSGGPLSLSLSLSLSVVNYKVPGQGEFYQGVLIGIAQWVWVGGWVACQEYGIPAIE